MTRFCFETRARMAPAMCAATFALSGAMLNGCGTMRDGRAWGEDVTLSPGFERVGQSALVAARDPVTWVPAAGALIVGLAHADEHIERSLSRRAPLFDSPDDAEHASDHLRDATRAMQLATLLLTPGGATFEEIAANKARGFALQFGAEFATKSATSGLKSAVARERPGNGTRTSFPSGHSSDAFANAALARENLAVIEMNAPARTALQWGTTLLAAATAYARVEAGVHYPTDVLAGAALGNFLSRWIYNAFIGTPLSVAVAPLHSGAVVTVGWNVAPRH
jgi:hypothetical protein